MASYKNIQKYTYKLKTACTETKRAGTLKVSKNISAAFSLFFRGLRGASVSKTGCWKKELTIKVRKDTNWIEFWTSEGICLITQQK